MGSIGRTIGAVVIAIMAGGCGGPGAAVRSEPPVPTEAAPAPAASISGDDCVALLHEGFARATALRDTAYTPENSRRAVSGEAIALRGATDQTVCIASRVTSWCEHERDAQGKCLELEATENVYAIGVVSTATRAVVEMNTFLGGYSGNESWDLLTWKVLPIGPDRDALVFDSASETAESETTRVIWMAFDGAHIREMLSYYRGYTDARGGRVEPRVTDRQTDGFFAIELDVCVGSWDYCEDEGGDGGDGGDAGDDESGADGEEREQAQRGTDVCSFDPTTRRYQCRPDLARQLAQMLRK